MRADGIAADYVPDFIVKTENIVYLIETKATKDMKDENVLRKEKSALYNLEQINKLDASFRENGTWVYALLSEDRFYRYSKNGANIHEMCATVKLVRETSDLFDI